MEGHGGHSIPFTFPYTITDFLHSHKVVSDTNVKALGFSQIPLTTPTLRGSPASEARPHLKILLLVVTAGF